MPVVLVVTNRTWTSVNATELNDHILCDGIFEGPTFITRDEFGIPPEEITLYKSINAHKVHDMTYSTNLKAATVLSRFVSYGYKIITSAGSGVGTSGKARYSADVSVTDYRWVWTLVKEDLGPPPYQSTSSSETFRSARSNDDCDRAFQNNQISKNIDL
ncbi:hypothetical protein SSS_02875 [Sarcoptes scabiei]|uniref:Uncharacterized protein n=1 Tax=Sarcoptes scabiei TaxID=52283 RepID=A0A834VG87_SARSC|nr:hypothetical protein SSS_02875 [Sarcoptes scabiei]